MSAKEGKRKVPENLEIVFLNLARPTIFIENVLIQHA